MTGNGEGAEKVMVAAINSPMMTIRFDEEMTSEEVTRLEHGRTRSDSEWTIDANQTRKRDFFFHGLGLPLVLARVSDTEGNWTCSALARLNLGRAGT